MSNGPFSSLRGLLQNPIQSYRDARQPGGLLAPVTSLNQFLGDPRVNIGLDLAAGRPLGESLERTAAIQQSLAPEAEEETFSILTELEKRTFGLDPNKTYQKSK